MYKMHVWMSLGRYIMGKMKHDLKVLEIESLFSNVS